MQPSTACLNLIKSFESCQLTAYRDIAGVLTIGWGHTGNVKPGETITQAAADALFEADVAKIAKGVSDAITVRVEQCQFDALVSLAYNIGMTNFHNSTLLKLINYGDVEEAAGQFQRWDHAGGVEVPGLLRRRVAEQNLYLGKVG